MFDASPKRERGLINSNTDDLAPLADSINNAANLTLTITFPGSNLVAPIAAQPQSARFNYYVGGDNRRAAGNVPSFGEIIYPNLYDGIDLHIAGSAACGFATGGNADGTPDSIRKYEFHVAPGADCFQI